MFVDVHRPEMEEKVMTEAASMPNDYDPWAGRDTQPEC